MVFCNKRVYDMSDGQEYCGILGVVRYHISGQTRFFSAFWTNDIGCNNCDTSTLSMFEKYKAYRFNCPGLYSGL